MELMLSIIYTLLQVGSLVSSSTANISESKFRKCANYNCDYPISIGQTNQKYPSRNKDFLSFENGVNVKIFSKETNDIFGVEIGGKKGLAMRNFIRVQQVNVEDNQLKEVPKGEETEFASLSTATQSSINNQNSVINNDKVDTTTSNSDAHEINSKDLGNKEPVAIINLRNKRTLLSLNGEDQEFIALSESVNSNQEHSDTNNKLNNNNIYNTDENRNFNTDSSGQNGVPAIPFRDNSVKNLNEKLSNLPSSSETALPVSNYGQASLDMSRKNNLEKINNGERKDYATTDNEDGKNGNGEENGKEVSHTLEEKFEEKGTPLFKTNEKLTEVTSAFHENDTIDVETKNKNVDEPSVINKENLSYLEDQAAGNQVGNVNEKKKETEEILKIAAKNEEGENKLSKIEVLKEQLQEDKIEVKSQLRDSEIKPTENHQLQDGQNQLAENTTNSSKNKHQNAEQYSESDNKPTENTRKISENEIKPAGNIEDSKVQSRPTENIEKNAKDQIDLTKTMKQDAKDQTVLMENVEQYVKNQSSPIENTEQVSNDQSDFTESIRQGAKDQIHLAKEQDANDQTVPTENIKPDAKGQNGVMGNTEQLFKDQNDQQIKQDAKDEIDLTKNTKQDANDQTVSTENMKYDAKGHNDLMGNTGILSKIQNGPTNKIKQDATDQFVLTKNMKQDANDHSAPTENVEQIVKDQRGLTKNIENKSVAERKLLEKEETTSATAEIEAQAEEKNSINYKHKPTAESFYEHQQNKEEPAKDNSENMPSSSSNIEPSVTARLATQTSPPTHNSYETKNDKSSVDTHSSTKAFEQDNSKSKTISPTTLPTTTVIDGTTIYENDFDNYQGNQHLESQTKSSHLNFTHTENSEGDVSSDFTSEFKEFSNTSIEMDDYETEKIFESFEGETLPPELENVIIDQEGQCSDSRYGFSTLKEHFLILTGALFPVDVSLAIEGEVVEPRMSKVTLILLIVIVIAIALFYVIHLIFMKYSQEGPLLERMNYIERANRVLKEEIKTLNNNMPSISSDEDYGKIQQLIKTMQDLEIKYREKESENEELRQNIELLNKELELATSNECELHKMLNELLANKKESDSFEDSVNHLQSMLNSQKEVVESLTQDLAMKTNLNDELKLELKETNSKITKLETQLEQLTTSLQESNTSKFNLSERCSNLDSSLEKFKSLYEKLKEESESKEIEYKNKDCELEKLTLQIRNLKTKFTAKDAECQITKECMKKLEIFSKSNDGNEKLSEIFEIIQTKSELATVKHNLSNTIKDLEVRSQSLKCLKEEVAVVRNENECAHAKLKELRHEKDKALSELNILSAYYEKKETQLKRELEKLKDKLENSEGSTERVSSKLETYETELSVAKKLNESLKKEMEDLEKDYKIQLVNEQQKYHETMLTLRRAERRQVGLRQESQQLRQIISQTGNKNVKQEIDKPKNEPNGSVSSPISDKMMNTSLDSTNLEAPPLLPPHLMMFPGGPPFPGMPPNGVPGLPGLPPVMPMLPPFFGQMPLPPPPLNRRIPPAGRMASPPAFNRSFSPSSDHSDRSYNRHSDSPISNARSDSPPAIYRSRNRAYDRSPSPPFRPEPRYPPGREYDQHFSPRDFREFKPLPRHKDSRNSRGDAHSPTSFSNEHYRRSSPIRGFRPPRNSSPERQNFTMPPRDRNPLPKIETNSRDSGERKPTYEYDSSYRDNSGR